MEHAKRVIVAMSGGVDSSVAALLLHEQGYEVIGVSMQVWDYRRSGCLSASAGKTSCCAPCDLNDARRVANMIGIPYYVFDFEELFEKEVIDKFVRSYGAGLTPNPCIDCNVKIKFGELRKRADSLGVGLLASGHYARIEKRSDGYHLLRGKDPVKDQSYFLYGLSQGDLAKTLFPLGSLTKAETRAIAARKGLKTAGKAESQDVCFVPGSVSDFLLAMGLAPRPGEIIRRDGTKVGSHDGIHRFTVGQRHGLKVGGSDAPLYVLGLDVSAGRVIVGKREELELSQSFLVGQLNWCGPQGFPGSWQKRFSCIAQLRYRHRGVAVEVELLDKYLVRVRFVGGPTAVCPGQAAVFYCMENEEVLGGGTILRDGE